MQRFRRISSLTVYGATIACALLAPLALHWLAGSTLAWLDTQALYAPQRGLIEDALRGFRLPLWNPYTGAGMPLLADAIHGVLHPVSLLTAWLRTARSADVLIGGYVACAGLGAALLARDLGASRASAAAAAFAYGGSGFVLSMAGNLVFLAGAGSLPFCVAGLRRFAVEPRPASLLFGAGGAAVLAFSGDAQALMVGGAIALALAWEGAGWRGAIRAVSAGVVGLLLAGVQLVPTAVHLPRTTRAAESWAREPLVWSFAPWRLPELALPGLCWGPDPTKDLVFAGLAGAGRWPAWNPPFPFAASVAAGLLPVTLAIFGAREARRGRLLALLSLLLLWAALGPTLGADQLIGGLPAWKAFRYSEKLIGPLTLLVALLAALGFDAVVERRARAGAVFAACVAVAVVSLGAALLAAYRLTPDVVPIANARILRGLWHLLVAALLLGAWLAVRPRLGPSAGKASLALLVWLGMAAATPAALRPGDPAHRLHAPGPSLVANAPGPRVLTPYRNAPPLTPGLDVYDQIGRMQAALGYADYNVRSRFDSLSQYAAMAPRRLSKLAGDFGPRWPLAARRYAVTHVVLDPPVNAAEEAAYGFATRGATRLAVAGEWETWALPHREWASFAPEVLLVDSEEEAVAATGRVVAAGSEGVVIVEGEARFGVAPGHVLSFERAIESLRLEAEADGDATLVLADAWWPGWRATLDGTDVPIFPADALVRAVRWPAGRHVLEMTYRPPEVRSGLLVSGLGVAVLAISLAFLRRAPPPAPPEARA